MSEKEFTSKTEEWHESVRNVAICVPSLDFVGWHGEHYVVVRSEVCVAGEDETQGQVREVVEVKELPARRRLDCGSGVDLGTEDAVWLERKDVPMDYEMPGLEV